MHDAAAEIQRFRERLDAWLDETYATQEDKTFRGETDSCYDGWHEIEAIVGRLFDSQSVQQLPSSAVDSILFFISRAEEDGRLIHWLGSAIGSRLSGVGDLTERDFLFLCRETLARPEDSSDYQLAACFRKFEHACSQYIDLLLRFFDRKDSYTRRISLHSLSHLRYSNAADLAVTLWNTDGCEFARLTALYTLKETHGADTVLAKYLAAFESEYDIGGNPHLQVHLKRLRESDR